MSVLLPLEAARVEEGVDLHRWGPTHDDEEDVLRSLFGEPDADGIYRGEPLDGDDE